MADKSNIASHRILSVTEEELRRIVLDIHDGPVQYLFAALSLLAGLHHEVETEHPESSSLQSNIARVEKLVESSLYEIKSFLSTFHPPKFQNRSLGAIVEGLLMQHEDWTGQSIDLRLEPIPQDVSLPSKIAIYRILQEALSNVHRHAASDKQQVKLWMEDKLICLQVRDNGRGFDPPPLEGPMATERNEHIGLRGMRDRIALVDGTFKLVSRPGHGTCILVRVPPYV